MTDQIPCSRCRHANPPENRFCGWCGASLGVGSDLVADRASNPTVMGHALPVKPGPVGKALAVGLVTLAIRTGLSWLRHRTTAKHHSSTFITREPGTTVLEGPLGHSLEQVLVQELEEDYRSRTFAWQAVRSIVVTEWMSSRERSTGSSLASSPALEPER